VAILAGGGGYYAGTKSVSSVAVTNNKQFGGAGGQGGRTNRFAGAGAAFGSIVAKDANSITVQLMGGPNASSTNGSATGSKIVLYSGSTEIGKTVAGTGSDLTVGESVVVNGTPNSDGSITAQMIQIRPVGMGRPGRQTGQ
jgi:hypothetical protein